MTVLALTLSAATATAFAAPAASSVRIDACALLEPAEISRVLERPVAPGQRNDDGVMADGGYSSTCLWLITSTADVSPDPNRPLRGRSFVILNAMQWPTGSAHSGTFLESFRRAAVQGELPSQPQARKFGDEALWWGDGLAVRRGDVSFGVSVIIPGSKPAKPGQREEQLATAILARLERDRRAARATSKY